MDQLSYSSRIRYVTLFYRICLLVINLLRFSVSFGINLKNLYLYTVMNNTFIIFVVNILGNIVCDIARAKKY